MTTNCNMKFVYAKDRRVFRPQRRKKEMLKFYNNLTDLLVQYMWKINLTTQTKDYFLIAGMFLKGDLGSVCLS